MAAETAQIAPQGAEASAPMVWAAIDEAGRVTAIVTSMQAARDCAHYRHGMAGRWREMEAGEALRGLLEGMAR